jgi:hypothetical protein
MVERQLERGALVGLQLAGWQRPEQRVNRRSSAARSGYLAQPGNAHLVQPRVRWDGSGTLSNSLAHRLQPYCGASSPVNANPHQTRHMPRWRATCPGRLLSAEQWAQWYPRAGTARIAGRLALRPKSLSRRVRFLAVQQVFSIACRRIWRRWSARSDSL